MAIKKSISNEPMPDFDAMIESADMEIEKEEVQEDISTQLAELKEVKKTLINARNDLINARLGVESAIQEMKLAEKSFDSKVKAISDKIDSINTKIDSFSTSLDSIITEAHQKLHIKVGLTPEIKEEIRKMVAAEFALKKKDLRDTLSQMYHISYEVKNDAYKRLMQNDGTWLGPYIQYFVWFFFVVGIVYAAISIFCELNDTFHWI